MNYYCDKCGFVKTVENRNGTMRCGYCGKVVEERNNEVRPTQEYLSSVMSADKKEHIISSSISSIWDRPSIGLYVKNIPDRVLNLAREKLKINFNEKIYIVYNISGSISNTSRKSTSFFGSVTSMLTEFIEDYDFIVFTNTGIAFENDNTAALFTWEEIKQAKYINGNLVLYFDDETDFCFPDSLFEKSQIPTEFAEAITRIAQAIENPNDIIGRDFEVILEANESENWNRVVELSNNFIAKYQHLYNENLTIYQVHDMLYDSYMELEKIEEASQSIQAAVKKFEKLNMDDWDNKDFFKSVYIDLKENEADNFYFLDKENEALWMYHSISLIIKNCNIDVNQKYVEYIDNRIAACYQEITENFIDIPFNERKIIYIDDEFPIKKPKGIFPLSIDSVNFIKFPPSHPIKKQLYISHPNKNDTYYPIESYENDIFLSQVMELCRILQCLGAKMIRIQHIKGDFSSIGFSDSSLIDEFNSYSYEGGLNMKLHSYTGEISQSNKQKNTSKNKQVKEITSEKGIYTVQLFEPTKKPYIPEDTQWYQFNSSWKTLAKQRLEGQLLKHEMQMSTSNTAIMSSMEKSHIVSEMESIVNGSYINPFLGVTLDSSKIKNKNETQVKIFNENSSSSTEWKIYVEFVPIAELLNESSKSLPKIETISVASSASNNFTDKEEDYIDFLKDAYDDNIISEDERKLLDKRRIKLNISPERALELENFVQSTSLKLTEAEEDYLDIFKDMMEDGKISEDERKLLDKRRVKLNISPERALELEKSVK